MAGNPELREIRDAAERGHLSWAYEKAERLLAESPDDTAVLGTSAARSFDLNLFDEAAERWEAALRLDDVPSENRAIRLENLAFANRRRWRLDEAEEAVWAAIRIAPGRPQCRRVLGRILKARGDLEGAFAAYGEAAKAEDPDTAAASLVDMARIRRTGGRYEDAFDLVGRAVELEEPCEEWSALAADLEEYLRESPRLLALRDGMEFREELFSSPGYGPSLRAALAERCIRSGEARSFVLARLAMALHTLERFPEARAVAARIPPQTRDAGNRYVFAYAGEGAAGMGDLEDAQDLLERAIEVSPMESGPYVYLGGILMERGLFEQAEVALLRGVDFDEPGDGELCYNLGQTLRCLRRYEEAIEYYERALELDPDYELVREPLEDVKRVLAERT